MGLIETYKNQIQRLCESHKVKILYSFGSVNTAKFTEDSDAVDRTIEINYKRSNDKNSQGRTEHQNF